MSSTIKCLDVEANVILLLGIVKMGGTVVGIRPKERNGPGRSDGVRTGWNIKKRVCG